jgi:hypothetical protein
VADHDRPEASRPEWHADGTAGEHDDGSHWQRWRQLGRWARPVQGNASLVGKPPFGGAAALDSIRSLNP